MIITDKKCGMAKSIARFNTTCLAEVSGPVTGFNDLRVKRISKEKGQLVMWERGFEDVILDKSEIQFVRVYAYNFLSTKGTNGFNYSTYIDVIINGELNRLKLMTCHIAPDAKRSKYSFDGAIPVVSGWVKNVAIPKQRDEHFLDPVCPKGYSPLIKEYVEGFTSKPDLLDLNIPVEEIDIPPYIMENPCLFDKIELPEGFVIPDGIDMTHHEIQQIVSEEKPKKIRKTNNVPELAASITALLLNLSLFVFSFIPWNVVVYTHYEYSSPDVIIKEEKIRLNLFQSASSKYLCSGWSTFFVISIIVGLLFAASIVVLLILKKNKNLILLLSSVGVVNSLVCSILFTYCYSTFGFERVKMLRVDHFEYQTLLFFILDFILMAFLLLIVVLSLLKILKNRKAAS